MADQLNTTAPSGRVGFINFDLVGAALLHTRLEKSCRWVLVALCSYANLTQHRAWPSVASLARRAGCSERTAQSRLRQLERAGYIHAIHNGQHSTVAYQIAADKLLHELSGSTNAAPPCAPAKTAPPPAKTVIEGVQMPHPKKQGEETTENRTEGHARAQTAWADITARTIEPTVPVLTSEATNTTPVLPSGTLERLNAQRKANGKGALTPRDLAQLHREATQAGLTPLDAAQWVLAKPQRNFFKADYYTPAAPPAPPHPAAQAAAHVLARLQPVPTPLTAEEQAAQAQAAQLARERVRAYLASVVHGKDGPTIRTRDGDGPTAPNMQWAHQAIALFIGGQTVSRYRLHTACEVLGIKLPATARPNAS